MRALLIGCMLLGGCANYVPSNLTDVAKRCKIPPPRIPKLRPGDNLIEHHKKLLRYYAVVASRLECTQRYIAQVTK